MPLKKYQLVEVEWMDSCTDRGWHSREEYLKTIAVDRCRTAGYLLKSSRTSLTVVQSQSDLTGNLTDSITIPRSAVKSVRKLV